MHTPKAASPRLKDLLHSGVSPCKDSDASYSWGRLYTQPWLWRNFCVALLSTPERKQQINTLQSREHFQRNVFLKPGFQLKCLLLNCKKKPNSVAHSSPPRLRLSKSTMAEIMRPKIKITQVLLRNHRFWMLLLSRPDTPATTNSHQEYGLR